MNESDYIDYLRTKDRRNMMSQLSESDINENDSSNYLASLLGQGVAMIGAGIAGRDPGRVGEQISDARIFQQRQLDAQRQQQQAIKQSQDLINPQSEISKRQRMLYSKFIGNIPEDVSASDLKDPIVLRGLQEQQIKLQPSVRGGGVSQTKPEKPIKLEQKDIDEMGAINQLRNTTDDLSSSINEYGNAYLGSEANKQDVLKQNLGAVLTVLTGQGAMTESDIAFWNSKLKKAYGESEKEYSKRLLDLQKNFVNKQINKLTNKGFTVEYHEPSKKYYVYPKGNNLDPIAEF